MKRWAVILAGGVGSRFWPLSTPTCPKQLLSLVEDHSMLEGTLRRLQPTFEMERVLVLTNELLVDKTLQTVPLLDKRNMIAEPRPAGTAAALAWAAREIVEREGGEEAAADVVMVCVHADWVIRDSEKFRATLERAMDVAMRFDSLVTVGIVPTRVETGFGHIEPLERIEGGSGAARARFYEKPKAEEARKMNARGFLWNSGIFVWRPVRFLEEIRALTPEVSSALATSSNMKSFFANVKSVSVDVGVMERSDRVMVLPGDFDWDDIGTWSALRRAVPLDTDGNAIRGKASLVQSANNVVFAQDSDVVLYGVNDLVVVSCSGITLVTTTELASDLKTLLNALPSELTKQ